MISSLRRWWARERDAARPLFLFVNVVQPHAPYTPTWNAAKAHFDSRQSWMAAMQRYSADGPRGLFERHYGRSDPLDAGEWELVRALYAAELEQTDRLARRLLELIDAGCDPDETLVLIVSDHGENLGDLDHTSHMFSLNEALTRVLCLARGPGFVAGARDARLAQLQDVYPTFLNAAGLDGSSYYDLPRWLHWITGNIGVHHVHHLASRIPNYRLQECFDQNEEFRRVTSLKLLDSFKCIMLTMWDEDAGRMVGFRHLKNRPAQSAAP